MLKNIVTAAVLAGVAAGIVAAILQFVFVVPALLEGELFESGARVHFATDGSPQSERGAPGLGDEAGRHAMTLAFGVVGYTGFGLILAGLMTLARDRAGASGGWRTGLVWGLAGFLAVQLAPAVGMPPVLPGTVGAEIVPRQLWWAGTILATALGLWLIAFGRSALPLAGIALILLPQLVGAPHLDRYWGVAPPELAAQFATLSLGTAAMGWATLGALTAWFLDRSDAA